MSLTEIQRTLNKVADLIQSHVLLRAEHIDQVHAILKVEIRFAIVVEITLHSLYNTYENVRHQEK